MTHQQLEALAVYRTHKYCVCKDCQTARVALRERDAGPFRKAEALRETDGARINEQG